MRRLCIRGIMKELIEGTEFKQVLLHTLLRFDEFCKQHNIKYSMAYGTALGSIRHKGFIPWDDDIDVLMMRSEYDKFVIAWSTYVENNKDRYEFWPEMDFDSHYMGSCAKFFDTHTLLIERFPKGRIVEYGIFVDIFVMDHIPVDKRVQENFFKKVKRQCKIVQHFQRHLKKWSQLVDKFNLPFPTLATVAKQLVKTKSTYNKEKTRLVSVTNDYIRIAPYNGSIYQHEWFQDFIEVDFEGYKLPIVSAYDAMLKSTYGDYMQLPAEEDRVGHKIEAYWQSN